MDLKPYSVDASSEDRVAAQQKAFGTWLEAGARLGLGLLVVTFAGYVFDLWEPHVPIEHLSNLWSLPVDEYRKLTGAPDGWGWLALLGRGDYQTYLGIAVLASASIVSFLRIAPALAARGERLAAAIALAQIVVLLLAASGVVAGGH
jgi:hypothetical protein